VAAVAAAAQTGVATAVGIIRWDGAFDAADAGAWRSALTWIAFVYAVSVVAGALIGRRAVRRGGRRDGQPARIAAALAATGGATAAVTVVWLPARGVHAPLGTNPGLVVTTMAAAGIVAGLVLALVALTAAPVAAGVRATVTWVWVVGIGSAAAGLAAGTSYPSPRLAVLDAPSLVPVAWWSGPWLMVGVAALLSLAVAGFARWAGAHRLGVALSGLAGPALVAVGYLVAGPGDGDAQLAPYRASLVATGVALLASCAVAVPQRRGERDTPETASETPAEAARPRPGWTAVDDGRNTEPARPSRPPVAATAGTVYTSESRPVTVIGRPPRGYEEYSDWLQTLGSPRGEYG
jgi:hypothetical protein